MTQDPKYGLPKLKKYPMPDAAHVRSAIKFFNYVTPSNEQELANAILARMEEYGMSPDSINVGDENRFKKYLTAKNELKHHGILGQKWGVRRFQNPDGTLTKAGRKRYGYNDEELIDNAKKYSKMKADKFLNEAQKNKQEYDRQRKMFDYGKTKEGLERFRKEFSVPKDADYKELKDLYLDTYEGERYHGGFFKNNINENAEKATAWTNHYLSLNNTKMKDLTDQDFEQARKMTNMFLSEFRDFDIDSASNYTFSNQDTKLRWFPQ